MLISGKGLCKFLEQKFLTRSDFRQKTVQFLATVAKYLVLCKPCIGTANFEDLLVEGNLLPRCFSKSVYRIIVK